MFHAMLYTGAIYLALSEGKTESEDTVYHLNQTISIVNKRMNAQPNFEDVEPHFQDSIIAAISCLALGEVRCLSLYRMSGQLMCLSLRRSQET